ncbi:MAG: sugar-binding protein [Chthoniobacteraceae bacterium]
MKNSATLLTFLFLLTAALGADPDAKTPKLVPPAKIFKTASPVVIDGQLDEPCWQQAVSIPVDYASGKIGVKSDSPCMTVKYTWDDHYLYIGYETFDSNLVALGSDVWKGPPGHLRQGCEIYKAKSKVDVVEFFISFGDEHFFWELHHNALNQFNDIWCVKLDPKWPIAKTTMASYGIIFNREQWVADDGEYTVAMAVKLKPKADGQPSTVNDPTDTDTGYTAEIRLPLRSIGVPVSAATWIDKKPGPRIPGPWKMAGQTISVLAVVQNGDLKDRYHDSSSTAKFDWFHNGEPSWPRYLFVAP